MESIVGGIFGFFAGIVFGLGWMAWPLLFVCVFASFNCGRRGRRVWAGLLAVPSLILFYNLINWGLWAFVVNHWITVLWVMGGSLAIGVVWCIFGRWNLYSSKFSVVARKELADFIKRWLARIEAAEKTTFLDSSLEELGYLPSRKIADRQSERPQPRYEEVSEGDKQTAKAKRDAAIAMLIKGELPPELEHKWAESTFSKRPRPSEHKAEITYWIFCWIFDIPYYIVTELAWDFIDGVLRWFGGVFSWVTSWHYRGMDPRYFK